MTTTNNNTIKIMSSSPEVIPGRPDLNAQKILSLMEAAAKENAKVLLLPEAVLTGANPGRLQYDKDFAADCDLYMDKIIKATATAGMPALFCGNFSFEKDILNYENSFAFKQDEKNNDAPIKAIQNGKILNINKDGYSEFTDFIFENTTLRLHLPERNATTILDENFSSGNSTEKVLFDENGLLFHLIYLSDSSVFSYQKAAEKQHSLNLIAQNSHLPFIYIQRNALENNGKNLFAAEGSTFIFTGEKDCNYVQNCNFTENRTTLLLNCETNLIERLFDVEGKSIEKTSFTYSPGYDFLALTDYNTLSDSQVPDGNNCSNISTLQEKNAFSLPASTCHNESCFRTPAVQYKALHFALKSFLKSCGIKRITIGISGGIDSALTAALYATILPAKDILLINMPGHYNSETTKNIAYKIAENIGCNYASIPIADFCDATERQFENTEITDLSTGEKNNLKLSILIKENIQARDRGSRILAGMAAAFGGAFSCNANKAECTVGYGTFYGDIAGLIASIGDLWKEEVFALTRYINVEIFKREVIPEEIFNIKPSAELSSEQTVGNGGDPLNYAYHDKLLRAFTEAPYRRSLSELLQLYLDGKIDAALGLKAENTESLTKNLFPTVEDFCNDMERWYNLYTGLAAAKRIQAPPVITLSMQPEEVVNDVQLSRYIPQSYKVLKEKAIATKKAEKKHD